MDEQKDQQTRLVTISCVTENRSPLSTCRDHQIDHRAKFSVIISHVHIRIIYTQGPFLTMGLRPASQSWVWLKNVTWCEPQVLQRCFLDYAVETSLIVRNRTWTYQWLDPVVKREASVQIHQQSPKQALMYSIYLFLLCKFSHKCYFQTNSTMPLSQNWEGMHIFNSHKPAWSVPGHNCAWP